MKAPPFKDSCSCATVCDRGLVRPENQDSHASDPAAGFFVVADGMGGGQGGAEASAIVAETFGKERWTGDFAARLGTVRRAIDASNAAIAAHARAAGFLQMGSTAAVLLFGETVPGEAAAVWVGDSRVYRVRAGKAALLTSDHTVANELFGRGAASDYNRKLPYAHILTRVLGVDGTVACDERRFGTEAGDRFLVCSDGVHDMLSTGRIGELVSSAATPDAAVRALAGAVRAAGAIDNFTATVVFLKQTK